MGHKRLFHGNALWKANPGRTQKLHSDSQLRFQIVLQTLAFVITCTQISTR